jgi:hypothetical protein
MDFISSSSPFKRVADAKYAPAAFPGEASHLFLVMFRRTSSSAAVNAH